MPESPDQGPRTPREADSKEPREADPKESGDGAVPVDDSQPRSAVAPAIPLLPRVTAPTVDPGSPETAVSSHATSSHATESTVRLPRRQRPASPVPWSLRRGDDDDPIRSWVPLGTVDSGVLASVDPAGLVGLEGRTWSLDWWVRAEDRWHHPSMEPAVTQSADGASPVVRTAMRVPGGEVVHRCGGAQISAGDWSGAAVLAEVRNDSAVPVAVALVLRPYRLDGPGGIGSVEMLGADPTQNGSAGGSGAAFAGVVVRVDDTDAVLVDRRPARVAHGTPAQVASSLLTGADVGLEPGVEPLTPRRFDVADTDPLEVAWVFPLAHTATLRVALAPVARAARTGRRGSRKRQPAPGLPLRAPEVSSLLGGWQRHTAEDPDLVWILDTAEQFTKWSAGMLRVAAPDAVTEALDPTVSDEPRAPHAQLETLCRALASLWPGELHLAVAAALIRTQRFSGRVEPRGGQDATIALLWVVVALLRGAGGAKHTDELVGPTAKALDWLDRSRSEDSCASDEALRQVAVGLSAVGQPELAERALALAATARRASGEAAPESTQRLLSELSAAMPGGRPMVDEEQPEGSMPGLVSKEGFDVVELAALRSRLFASVVADEPEGPALFGLWSAPWNGRQVEVHRMPTAWGRVSAAVRWHGENPALLWDVQPWFGPTDGVSAPVITAPGLSPRWSGTGWSGEALLSADADG